MRRWPCLRQLWRVAGPWQVLDSGHQAIESGPREVQRLQAGTYLATLDALVGRAQRGHDAFDFTEHLCVDLFGQLRDDDVQSRQHLQHPLPGLGALVAAAFQGTQQVPRVQEVAPRVRVVVISGHLTVGVFRLRSRLGMSRGIPQGHPTLPRARGVDAGSPVHR